MIFLNCRLLVVQKISEAHDHGEKKKGQGLQAPHLPLTKLSPHESPSFNIPQLDLPQEISKSL
jgi:hypothetical protein